MSPWDLPPTSSPPPGSAHLLPQLKCSCSEVEVLPSSVRPQRGLEARIWGICRAGAYDLAETIWTGSSG